MDLMDILKSSYSTHATITLSVDAELHTHFCLVEIGILFPPHKTLLFTIIALCRVAERGVVEVDDHNDVIKGAEVHVDDLYLDAEAQVHPSALAAAYSIQSVDVSVNG